MNNKHFDYTPTDGFGGTYSVFFSNKLQEANNFFLETHIKPKAPIFIVDKNLPNEFVTQVEEITGYKAENILLIDPTQKTIDRILAIWDQMVRTVPDMAFVIGGGTVCDLSGFACANYQRGIPRVIFPTTVLSIVDASIGGKSGIDFGDVKNSIGAIHYPLVTINYIPFLKDLDEREYNSGFAEILKASVLYDADFFQKLYELKDHKSINEKTLDIFIRSSRRKATVCEQENKKKISLLYGHAVAHAVERYESTHLRHGDCVGIGMTVEGAMACVLGIWNKEEWLKQQEIIKKFELPSRMPEYIDLTDLTKKMMLYKKLVDKENFLFSLPKTFGQINNQESTYLTAVNKSEMVNVLAKTLAWIEENKRG